MVQIHTVPTHATGLPVRVIKVEVVAGPDAGRSHVAKADTVTIGTAPGNDLVLTDPRVSRYHLELSPHVDRIRLADRGSTNGTEIGPARVRDATVTVAASTTVTIGDTTLRLDDGGVMIVPTSPKPVAGIVGRTPQMQQFMGKIRRVAEHDASVLILGESGTGKELIARAIHSLGSRKDEPFVTVDCAALTPTLIGSELFGHERGAFTGASRTHIGAFERAHGGTVFLDELGELPDAMQAALLGALERRSFRRVGGTQSIDVDVRLVSATNSDLRARVNAGTFRLDLYYRLAVVLASIPPLRERPADIPLLVDHFLADAGHAGSRDALFPADALERLKAHTWPGNVRELRNVVLRAIATGEEPEVDPLHAAASEGGDLVAPVLELPYKQAKRHVLDHFERRYLEALLGRAGGSVRAAAREGKMDRSHLTELLRRHGIV